MNYRGNAYTNSCINNVDDKYINYINGVITMLTKLTYPAVLSKNQYEDQILYNVTFPDISTANTYGTNIKDARTNAETLLKILISDKDKLPESSTMVKIQDNYPDSIVSLITISI